MMFFTFTRRLTRRLSETAFDRVGQLNPQLLREWQGRLKWRNLLFTFLLSAVVQGVLILKTLVELPVHKNANARYCLVVENISHCQLDQWDKPLINWPFVWADIFRDASFVMVWVLIIGGVYLLAADLSKESRRGTLNFLRMSPQPGQQILTGKLLGVPVLLYLGVGALLPLHMSAGAMAGYPMGRLGLFYVLLGAIAFCYYAAALWFALLAEKLQGFQTWLISALSGGLLLLGWEFEHYKFAGDWFRLFSPLHLLADWKVMGLDSRTDWAFSQGERLHGYRELGWFLLPVGHHANLFWAFALVNAIGLGLWFWVALKRKFQSPTKTTISKRQSYGLTVFFSVVVIGFDLQTIPVREGLYARSLMTAFWSYSVSMMIWCIVLMFLLLPAKQTLLDWTRYRHQQPREGSKALSIDEQLRDSQTKNRPTGNSLMRDLLLHDNSPSTLAYFLNLCIMGSVLLLGSGVYHLKGHIIAASGEFLGLLISASVLLACALIIQLIALMNLHHWRWVAAGTVAAVIGGWPIILAMLGVDSYSGVSNYLWLTTAFSSHVVGGASGLILLGAIASHLAVLASLSLLLTRRCKVLGYSEWKALLASEGRQGYARELG
ncbi:MAG: hypothetical protein AAFQ74_21680 [Cyanobacteria bacterium J06623_4]